MESAIIQSRALLSGTTALGLLLWPVAGHAQTLPSGGAVTHGEATISQSGSGLLINQTSHNAILSWDSFSIGGGAGAHFENGAGATLNRVTGNLSSIIDGTLTATGSLYLVNPAGIAVGTGGMVRTGGSFVASTHGIADRDSLDGGDMVFSGTSGAGILNEGLIAALGGDVVLTARRVENSGTILAPQGDVGLLAGYEVLLRDLATDEGRFAVRVGGADTEVVNSGTIDAANAELRANGGNIYALAGNTKGIITATGVSTQGGRIFLTAGEGGSVTATQRMVARPAQQVAALPETGPVPPERPAALGGMVRISAERVLLGGEIDVSGDAIPGGTIIAVAKERLELTAGAALDASGSEGGLILLGGDFQGGTDAANNYWHEDIGTTATTLVAAGATIRADASAGAGGDIVVWGDGHTGFSGAISATGVTRGGDAEVSSKATLAYSGIADLRASAGGFGTLLLDPYNITISAAADSGHTAFTATGNDSVINANTLVAALDYANVTVTTGAGGSQPGNITVDAALGWYTDATLSLQAAGNIVLNEAITARAGGLTLDAGGEIGTGAEGAVEVARFTLQNGAWVQNAASLPGFAAGDFRITGGSFLRATGGTGTGADPWLLTDIYGVQGMATRLSGNFALANNIDATGTQYWWGEAGFVPVGNNSNSFTGTFDGQHHVISGLTIDRASINDVGLFGRTKDAAIANVGVEAGSVTGGSSVGGLVGRYEGGTIDQVWVTGIVSADNTSSSTGGIVGEQFGGTIARSWADVAVSGGADVGGLVGGSRSGGRIEQSWASGTVTGTSPDSGSVGGLVGWQTSGSTEHSWSSATVTGSHNVGGLIGGQSASITSHTWASGAVSGSGTVGGLVGYQPNGTVSASFWDMGTTGQGAVGRGDGLGTFDAAGLTTAQARGGQTGIAYAGWNFTTVWYQDRDLRPILRAFAAPDNDGDGVYEVSTLMQLQLMGANLGRSYVLTNDLDASIADGADASGIWGTGGFVPVGRTNNANSFTGKFDGQGHVISGLTIDRIGPNNVGGEEFVGLFGRTHQATITNIGIEGGTITGNSHVGALVGYQSFGSIGQSWASGTVTGFSIVGGLVGNVLNGNISRSWTSAAVSGTSGNPTVGGLVGLYSGGRIDQSWASGAVSASGGGNNTKIGGLVGHQNGSIINQSWASGAINVSPTNTAKTYVGGFVGQRSAGGTSASYWDTGTTGMTQGVGSGSLDGVTGLTTENFRGTGGNSANWLVTLATAAGWDFGTVWYQAGDLRPILRASAGPTIGGVTYISSLMQLQLMRSDLDGDYVLTTDLDASIADGSGEAGIWGSDGFLPVGDNTGFFTGSFDGQGHVISNLTINRPTQDYVGLFGRTVDADIANVGLEDAAIIGNWYVGALMGYQQGGSIDQSIAGGTVDGIWFVGGLVGTQTGDGAIDRSLASVTVDGSRAATGSDSYVGGLVGHQTGNGIIDRSFASGTVDSSGNYVGGLVGRQSIHGTISHSFASGAVTGDNHVGGLVGHQFDSSTISQSFATGLVTGSGNYVGGLAGWQGGAVTASYWNTDTTGQALGRGGESSGATSNATGLTTVEFQDTAGFVALARVDSWDFATVWAPSSAGRYPQLYALSRIVAVEAPSFTRLYGEANPTDLPLLRYYGLQPGDFLRTGAALAGLPNATANVGDYAVTASGGATTTDPEAYRFLYLPGRITITPRPITVTANAGQGKTYGDDDPVFTYGVTPGSLVFGHGFSGALGRAAGEDVNNYALDIGDLLVDDGNGGNNYIITFTGADLTITPRAITVTADDLRKFLGQADPALGWAITGGSLADFDAIPGVFSGALARDAGGLPGGYAIRQGTLVANSNYALTLIEGVLTIEPAAVTTPGLSEPSLPFIDPALQTAESELVLCIDGVLPEAGCIVYTHPANRGLDHVRFAQ